MSKGARGDGMGKDLNSKRSNLSLNSVGKAGSKAKNSNFFLTYQTIDPLDSLAADDSILVE